MARDSLKALSRRPLKLAEVMKMFVALSEDSDRAAAILGCVQVEEALEKAVLSRFRPDLSKQDIGYLIQADNPLATFAAKIKVAYALGLFGTQTRADLNCIRDIRNAFAHAKVPIAFDTPEVAAACATLTYPFGGPGTADKHLWTARERYLRAINQLVIDLFTVSEERDDVTFPISPLP